MTLRELVNVSGNNLIMVKEQGETEFKPAVKMSVYEMNREVIWVEGTKYPMFDNVLEVTISKWSNQKG